MSVNAIGAVGHGDKAEQAKKAKKQNPVDDGFHQFVVQYNAFKANPAMIGNLLNGQASHQG